MLTDTPKLVRLELFGGPMDGDHRTTKEFDLYFSAYESGYVHRYARAERGFEWQGLVAVALTMRVFSLRPGERS
jgi:hypothetical protein